MKLQRDPLRAQKSQFLRPDKGEAVAGTLLWFCTLSVSMVWFGLSVFVCVLSVFVCVLSVFFFCLFCLLVGFVSCLICAWLRSVAIVGLGDTLWGQFWTACDWWCLMCRETEFDVLVLRSVITWNSVPLYIIHITNHKQFKIALKEQLLEQQLQQT